MGDQDSDDWPTHCAHLRNLVFGYWNVLEQMPAFSEQAQALLRGPMEEIRTALIRLRHLTDVFVCYSGPDRDHVIAVLNTMRERLKLRYVHFWRDGERIEGPAWREEILKALDIVGCALAFSSRNFEQTQFILEVELPELLKKSDPNVFGRLEIRLNALRDSPPACVAQMTNWTRFPGTGFVLGSDSQPDPQVLAQCEKILFRRILLILATVSKVPNAPRQFLYDWYLKEFGDSPFPDL
jgi:hypothetical protein